MSRRVRVAFLVPSLSGGGAERATITVANRLDEALFERTLVIERDTRPSYPVDATIAVERLGATRAREAVAPLVRVLRDRRPDVLYSALPHLNVLAALARLAVPKGPRLIVSVHNNQSQELGDARHGWKMRRIMPLVYRTADAIVAVSDGVAEELAAATDQRGRISVLPNPIDLEAIDRLKIEPLDHPWFGGRFRVVIGVGRLTRQKGFDVLVEAFSLVARRDTAARLVVIGEGEDEPQLRHQIEALGLADRIALMGFQDNPFKYLARSACLAVPSRWEGFGMVIVEALAAGVPVVAADCRYGPAEVLEGGGSGLLVAPESPVALAGGLDQVLGDHDLRRRLIARGRIRARAFDATNVARRYAALLTSVAELDDESC